MVRKFLLYFEFVLIGSLQVFWIVSAFIGFFPASAQSPPPSDTAHRIRTHTERPQHRAGFHGCTAAFGRY